MDNNGFIDTQKLTEIMNKKDEELHKEGKIITEAYLEIDGHKIGLNVPRYIPKKEIQKEYQCMRCKKVYNDEINIKYFEWIEK